MEEIFDSLLRGKIKLYELENVIWQRIYSGDKRKWHQANKDAAFLRLKFLKEKTGTSLDDVERCYVEVSSSEKLTTGIEQQIGGAATPLGIGGPLMITGDYAKGEFYLPLATNEAALIAGINRGCKAINLSGGIKAKVTRDCMARAPLIEAESIIEAAEIAERLKADRKFSEEIRKACEAESKVTKLLEIQPFQLGRYVHVRFVFNTGDAMGMNSATKYSANGVKVILKEFPEARLITLTANMCSDKKATHSNVLLGRGKTVHTEVAIGPETIRKVFGIDPEKIVRLNNLKNYQGSAFAGTVTGFNANAANTVAALFIATGQDCAQIVESSSCFTHAEMENNNLVFGVTMPCLEVAATGGGTDFGTAKECLQLLGCHGPSKTTAGSHSKRLAAIIASAVTAQELNLLSSETNLFELAESHIRLARGK
ncbi:MAG: hydroxymethylglutaryl-CoA reductase [Candidatus Aenigmarchaeota archaeon]|nr:hydroxymethylglutaryl-CoA reductase [Candidatus Aenigmarchaeota archaeon]